MKYYILPRCIWYLYIYYSLTSTTSLRRIGMIPINQPVAMGCKNRSDRNHVGFLKWGYTYIIHVHGIFPCKPYKPSILGMAQNERPWGTIILIIQLLGYLILIHGQITYNWRYPKNGDRLIVMMDHHVRGDHSAMPRWDPTKMVFRVGIYWHFQEEWLFLVEHLGRHYQSFSGPISPKISSYTLISQMALCLFF